MKGSLNVIPGAELAQTIKQILLPVAGMLIFISLWHLAAPQLNTSMGTFPGPAQVWEQGGQLWQEHTLQKQQAAKYSGSPTFPDQVTTSLMTVIAGFLLATAIAVPLGILLGLNQSLLAAVNPLIQIFRPVSPLAWLPLVTMVVSAFYVSDDPMFEASFLTSVITVILCSLWPTLINTGAGVAAVNSDLLNVSRVLRLSLRTHVRKVVLPSSLPMIFTGLRVSLGIAWMVLIAAEMLAQSPGIGKFVWDEFQSGNSQSLSRIMVAVLTIGFIGFLLDLIMQLIQNSIAWSE
jgi:nitrate/nitrite transport system permease protein